MKDEVERERWAQLLVMTAINAAGIETLLSVEARRDAEAGRPSGQPEFEKLYRSAIHELKVVQQGFLEAIWSDHNLQSLTRIPCPRVEDDDQAQGQTQ